MRLLYDVTPAIAVVGFAGYAPDEYGQQIVWAGSGLRLKLPRDLVAFGDLGDAHYPSGIIPDYQYWRAGIDYPLTDWATVGVAYHGTTLNARECALVAESLLGNSCDPGVMARLSLWFDGTDVREVLDGSSVRRQVNQDSAEPPPLEALVDKLPRKRINDDDDPW